MRTAAPGEPRRLGTESNLRRERTTNGAGRDVKHQHRNPDRVRGAGDYLSKEQGRVCINAQIFPPWQRTTRRAHAFLGFL